MAGSRSQILKNSEFFPAMTLEDDRTHVVVDDAVQASAPRGDAVPPSVRSVLMSHGNRAAPVVPSRAASRCPFHQPIAPPDEE